MKLNWIFPVGKKVVHIPASSGLLMVYKLIVLMGGYVFGANFSKKGSDILKIFVFTEITACHSNTRNTEKKNIKII